MTSACASPTPPPSSESAVLASLRTRTARFAPVNIEADASALPDHEQRALGHLIEAARLMDGLFLEQVWAGNSSQLARLGADRSPEGQAELHYFLINKGPWSRLDHNEPFLRATAGVPAKPPQANFYPADASKEAELARVRTRLEQAGAGDLARGREVFARTCQQCHTLFGEGGKLGPELTGSNRADLDYLLTNVIDPNQVIGKDYQVTNAFLKDGRVVVRQLLAEGQAASVLFFSLLQFVLLH